MICVEYIFHTPSSINYIPRLSARQRLAPSALIPAPPSAAIRNQSAPSCHIHDGEVDKTASPPKIATAYWPTYGLNPRTSTADSLWQPQTGRGQHHCLEVPRASLSARPQTDRRDCLSKPKCEHCNPTTRRRAPSHHESPDLLTSASAYEAPEVCASSYL